MSATADTLRGVLAAVDRILNRGGAPHALLDDVVQALHRIDGYSWVGIYLVDGDELVLGPWSGTEATEHVRIPIGQGICGAAAATGETEVVADVRAADRYLACFPSTRSEIVVPIVHEGRLVGEIDVDSDRAAAFGDADRTFLERVALLVSSQCAAARNAGGAPAAGGR